jgi:hypothetical protein
LSAGEGPFPGVIDMFGTGGGLYDVRAALLASRGFAGFSLAFFGYDDLPTAVELNVEYFTVACDVIAISFHSHFENYCHERTSDRCNILAKCSEFEVLDEAVVIENYLAN